MLWMSAAQGVTASPENANECFREHFLKHSVTNSLSRPDRLLARWPLPGESHGSPQEWWHLEVKTRILIVDDDLRLRALLQTYLEQQGFQVLGVGSGEQMRRALTREAVDLVVLDLMLPDEDGLAICAKLRAEGNPIPVLMLTAKGDDLDRILGLEIGADDYLPKPCNPRELVARIKAILRRQPDARPVGAPMQGGGVVEFGPYRLDLGSRALSRGGELIALTSGEFALLSLFVQHPGETLSRDRLVTLTRGRDAGPYDRSVDVQVSRLRRILEENPSKPRHIQTVWGVGYVFVPEESRD